MKKMGLTNFSLMELEILKEFIGQYDDILKLQKDLEMEILKIKKDKKQSLNSRFDLNMFIKLNIFTPLEIEILKLNGIGNLQDLIDCSLDELIGITESMKEKFEWSRKFYDFSDIDSHNNEKKNYVKK